MCTGIITYMYMYVVHYEYVRTVRARTYGNN